MIYITRVWHQNKTHLIIAENQKESGAAVKQFTNKGGSVISSTTIGDALGDVTVIRRN